MKRIAALILLVALAACGDNQTAQKPPKLGASLLSGNSIRSVSITDSTATGRGLMTCASPSACRTTLGLQDVGDLRNYAVADAISLLSLTRPQVVVDESFNTQPGATNSVFNAVGGTLAQSTLGQGGWFKLTTAAGASSAAATHNNQRNPIVTNPSTKKWYCLWLVAVSSVVDSGTILRFGLYDASLATENGFFAGIYGVTSAVKFGFFQENATVYSGVLSTVSIDLDVIHVFRMWGDGAGAFYGSVDFESAQTAAATVTTALMPHMILYNGAGGGARAASFGHAIYITE